MHESSLQCAICGGRVHEYEKIRFEYLDEEYYFCSDEHREEFERTPEQFR